MKNRIFILSLVLLTIGVTLWSSVAMVMAGATASSEAESSVTDSKTTSSQPPKSTATNTKSGSAGTGSKNGGGSSEKALDNGPKVAPREIIQPIEAIQKREPIAPRG